MTEDVAVLRMFFVMEVVCGLYQLVIALEPKNLVYQFAHIPCLGYLEGISQTVDTPKFDVHLICPLHKLLLYLFHYIYILG